MDLNEYVENATSTESLVEVVRADPRMLASTLQIIIAAGEILDQIKKNVFYERDFNNEKITAEFANIVDSLDGLKACIVEGIAPQETRYNPRLFHSIVGIATEAVELLEGLSNEEFDRVNFLEELGDLNWYQAIGIDAVQGNFANVLEANIKKLLKSDKARYKKGFTKDEAVNRDTDAEREILTSELGSETGC